MNKTKSKTQKKGKPTSKQSGNHTFLSLTNKRGSESKVISNYYDKIDGTVERAPSKLVDILTSQVISNGLVYAIHYLRTHMETSSNETIQRLYQVSKIQLRKPTEATIKFKDAIYTYIIDGGAVPEVPVEFIVDAYLQDGKWYQYLDSTIPLATCCTCNGINNASLVPRPLLAEEYELLSNLSKTDINLKFSKQKAGEGTGISNVSKWLDEADDEEDVEVKIEDEYVIMNKIPNLSKMINIDPETGLTNDQIIEVLKIDEQEGKLIHNELFLLTEKMDLSFIIPTNQNKVMLKSEKFAGIVQYLKAQYDFNTLDVVIPYCSKQKATVTEDGKAEVIEETEESSIEVGKLLTLAYILVSGLNKPMKKAMKKPTPVSKKKITTSNMLSTNTKLVQKSDEGKEEMAEVLETVIRHLQHTGTIIPTTPSTMLTAVNGKETFGLQRGQLIHGGKILGRKALHCVIKYASGQIYFWDLWTRIMGKLLIDDDPNNQTMATSFFNSMFTPEGVKEVSKKHTANSLLTEALIGHSYGNMTMATIWNLAEQTDNTVDKMRLLNILSEQVILEPVIEGGNKKMFLRHDYDIWIGEVGKMVKDSGNLINVVDWVKINFGFHPFVSDKGVDEYPMSKWEQLTGDIYLEEEAYPALVEEINEKNEWRELKGRTHLPLTTMCKILRGKNSNINLTLTLPNDVMEVLVAVFKEKKEDWNVDPDNGWLRQMDYEVASEDNDYVVEEESLTSQSALSVVASLDPKHYKGKHEDIKHLDQIKINQLQNEITKDLCVSFVMTDQCNKGDKCNLRHTMLLNHQDTSALVQGVKKLATGDPNASVNVMLKGSAKKKASRYDKENPGVRKKLVKQEKFQRINSTKRDSGESKNSQKSNNKNAPDKETKDSNQSYWNTKGNRGNGKGKSGSRGGGYGNRGRGRGKGNDYQRNEDSKPPPSRNRGREWKTGDLSLEGRSVFIGKDRNLKMIFIERDEFGRLENNIFGTLKTVFQDMINFGSVAGFSQFFEKCRHGCGYHTSHHKTCICGGPNSSNCGAYPCIVTAFVPRMVEEEKVGLRNLGNLINMGKNGYKGPTGADVHCPWRAAMSKRQKDNDDKNIAQNKAVDSNPGDGTSNKGTMVLFKGEQELQQEEDELLRKLNMIKEKKNKIHGENKSKETYTRFIRVDGN